MILSLWCVLIGVSDGTPEADRRAGLADGFEREEGFDAAFFGWSRVRRAGERMSRDPRFDLLFEPVQIGPVTAPNRFYQVPHCTGMGYRRPRTVAEMRGVKARRLGCGVYGVLLDPLDVG